MIKFVSCNYGALLFRGAFFMSEIILSLILLVVLISSYIERKDLYNRLMAKSLEDLKVNTQRDEPNQVDETDPNIVPLEEAFEEIEEDLNDR